MAVSSVWLRQNQSEGLYKPFGMQLPHYKYYNYVS